MKTLKRTYTPPRMDVSEVELESPICSGSVQFGDREKSIVIEDQSFNAGTENDFSGQAWDMDANTPNS